MSLLFILAFTNDLQCWSLPFSWQKFLDVDMFPGMSIKDLQDMVEIVWGMAITITIFMLGISNQYRYGISLKTVVNYTVSSVPLFIGAAGYLMLYPLMFFAVHLSLKCTAIWCTVTTLLTFGMALTFSISIFKKKSVRKLLIDLTNQRIKSLSKALENQVFNIHSKIDSFPITDFILHIDYKNAEETRCLIDTLSEVVKTSRADRGVEELNVADMTLLTTWVGHIIYQSGTGTEKEKARTIRILTELWKKLPRKNRLYDTVQMMIPFIDMKNDTGMEMMGRFFRIISLDSAALIMYLLLYMEYRYWFEDQRIPEWICIRNMHGRIWMEDVFRGKAALDKEIAWIFWRSWILYNSYDGQIGLEYFYIFCEDWKKVRWTRNRKHDFQSVIFNKLLEEELR